MKVEWEFYRKYRAFEFLPRIAFWWDCGSYAITISWLRWSIDIEFNWGNVACR